LSAYLIAHDVLANTGKILLMLILWGKMSLW